jgi:hypothetical protein
MKPVFVCSSCGRTIDSDFIYCPWCGQSRLEDDDKASLDAVFRQLEEQQQDDRQKRLLRMENRLDELEKDLSVLALSAEMHK